MKFQILSLLSKTEDNDITGPMSPLLFAKDMARSGDFKFNRLARICFDEEKIFQQQEDGGLTGYDTLLIGCQYKNDLWLSLWIDKGVGGVPVAMCYQSDREVTITPVYDRQQFIQKLSKEDIQQVFNYVFENTTLLEIRRYTNK